MRRRLVLGIGLAGVLTGGTAVGQFASDKGPAALPQPKTALPPPVGGVMPATGFGTLAPPPGGGAAIPTTPVPALTPAEIPTTLGTDHPWLVKPEHGAYLICVKSYSRPARPDANDPGPTARELAEALGTEIREVQKTNVYLFEYISEEKRAEYQAAAQARQRVQAFAASMDVYKQKSQLQGMEFLEPDQKVRYKTFNYRDQVAVLVGGFKTDEEARKALDKIRTWAPPKNPLLMDGGAVVKPGANGQSVIEKTRLNPYQQAMVVPNPAIPRAASASATPSMDPFVVKLNEGRPYNLLKATRSWTLGVKSFSAPVQITTRDDEGTSMRRPGSSGADVLNAGAEQAEMLAKALREMKGPGGRPLGLEAFVLHTRTGSIVTVGQFDSPNDPALIEARRMLVNLKLNVSKDAMGAQPTGDKPEMFPNVFPVPIPKP